MGSMKKWWITFFFAGTAISAASSHAATLTEAVRAALATAPSILAGNPVSVAIVIGIAAVTVLAGTMLIRHAAARRRQSGTQGSGAFSAQAAAPPRREPSLRPMARPAAFHEKTDTVIAPGGVPADVDIPTFLRKSKAAFMQLQAAWDQADLKTIRRLTTRELYAEFSTQLMQRGGAPNVTEIVTLMAQLQSMKNADGYQQAIVKFTGLSKCEAGAKGVPFTEVWRLSRPLDGHRSWLVAGIEQY